MRVGESGNEWYFYLSVRKSGKREKGVGGWEKEWFGFIKLRKNRASILKLLAMAKYTMTTPVGVRDSGRFRLNLRSSCFEPTERTTLDAESKEHSSDV